PSPAAGKLLSINVAEGETVEIGSVLALVGAEGAAGASPTPQPAQQAAPAPAASETAKPAAAPVPQVTAVATNAGDGGNGSKSVDELRRLKSSPLVRNIAKEHGIDITRIPGSGVSGRVTKKDIMAFIETGAALRPEDLLVKGGSATSARPAARSEYTPTPITTSAGDRV